MSEGLPIVDFLRAFLYAFALRRAGGFLPLHLVILPLPLPVFRQALAADPVEYAFVDVIIDRLFADLRFEGQPQPLDHVLLYGPPGLGKTTLSSIIAHELGVNLRITTGPAIEKPGDLVSLLTSLSDNDVLFIDEIHRLSRAVEEILYPALEDRVIDIIIGKGPSARSIRMDLKPFTLIGATTRAGQLSAPLRDRFGVIQRLELYSTEQLTDIIRRSAMILGIPCETDGAAEIAGRSRGTPRIANRLLKRVRDFADVMGNGQITKQIASIALSRLEIDELGLDSLDRRMLQMIIKGYGGGPVGLDTLASAIGEEAITLEDVCEPFLMQLGFLGRTPRGRCATKLAYEHLGITPPDDSGMPKGQLTF